MRSPARLCRPALAPSAPDGAPIQHTVPALQLYTYSTTRQWNRCVYSCDTCAAADWRPKPRSHAGETTPLAGEAWGEAASPATSLEELHAKRSALDLLRHLHEDAVFALEHAPDDVRLLEILKVRHSVALCFRCLRGCDSAFASWVRCTRG